MKKAIAAILCAFVLMCTVACTAQTEPEPESTDIGQTFTEWPSTTRWQKPLDGLDYDRSKVGSYGIGSDHFVLDDTIEFEYPQLVHMEDTNQQKKLNLLICEFATNNFSEEMPIESDPESTYPSPSLEVNYHIPLQTPELLSIVFEGWGQSPPAAPYPYVRALTLDINTLRLLKFRDFVQLDDDFAERFFTKGRILDSEGNPTDQLSKENFTKDYLFEKIMGHDSASSQVFYLTPESIVFELRMISREYFWVEVPLEG